MKDDPFTTSSALCLCECDVMSCGGEREEEEEEKGGRETESDT